MIAQTEGAPLPSKDRVRLTLLDRVPTDAVCAEIGVWKGAFSQLILQHAKPRELHLVDPWRFAPEFPRRWYGGWQAKSQKDMDAIYDGVIGRFHKSTTVRIHRQSSLEAAAGFPDGTFDFVYIDGNHSYTDVLNDLGAWRPKIKTGGILSGDDWQWRDESGRRSVEAAVTTFARDAGLTVEVLLGGQFVIRI